MMHVSARDKYITGDKVAEAICLGLGASVLPMWPRVWASIWMHVISILESGMVVSFLPRFTLLLAMLVSCSLASKTLSLCHICRHYALTKDFGLDSLCLNPKKKKKDYCIFHRQYTHGRGLVFSLLPTVNCFPKAYLLYCPRFLGIIIYEAALRIPIFPTNFGENIYLQTFALPIPIWVFS